MNRQSQTANEGVVKFLMRHTLAPLPTWARTDALQYWFARARALDLIGRHPDRYEGAAYGNISQRVPAEGFLITGTGTGGRPYIGPEQLCWVQSVDAEHNLVISTGPIAPSSESMSHAQVYALLPSVQFVIHVHSPVIWSQAQRLNLPFTNAHAAYGTPAMAAEVARLLRRPEVIEGGCIVMGGHQDGILVFGDTPQVAGQHLLRLVDS